MTQQIIRAIAYWRMSTALQEESITNQREALLPVLQRETPAERIDLVREFADKGISGTSTKGRDAFLEMIAFCQQQHRLRVPVQMVAVLETSRFSRADSIETDAALHELREAGVRWLQTKAQRFDLRDEADLTVLALQQNYSNHKFSRTHSERVTRGRAAGFRKKGAPTASTPYGMDRIVIVRTSAGEREERVARVKKIIRRDERQRMKEDGTLPPKFTGEAVRYEPSTLNKQEAQIVREIFDRFTRPGDVSLRSIARDLNDRKIEPARPGKKNVGWTGCAVRRVLTNPVYTGQMLYGRRARGKFTRLVDQGGQLVQVEGYFAETPPQINPNPIRPEKSPTVTALVDLKTFELAQQKLAKRTAACVKPRRSKHQIDEPLLKGLLHCTTCDCRMGTAFKLDELSTGDVVVRRAYQCHTIQSKPGRASARHYVQEGRLVPTLARVIGQHALYLRDKLQDALMAEALAKQPLPGFDQAAHFQDKLIDLDAVIAQTVRNLARATDNFDILNGELTRLRKERDAVAAEAEKCQPPAESPADLALRVKEQVRQLEELGDNLLLASGPDFATALHRIVERIDIHLIPVLVGKAVKRMKHEISKVLVQVREIPELVDVTSLLQCAPHPRKMASSGE